MVEHLPHQDIPEKNKELSQESNLEQHSNITKQQLLELNSEITHTSARETNESDIYINPYEGVDVEGNINPYIYYREFMDFTHKEQPLLVDSIVKIHSAEQLMPMISDTSDQTYIISIAANWCKPSLKSLPELNKFAQENADRSNVNISYLDVESAPGMLNYLRSALQQPELGSSFPQLISLHRGTIIAAHLGVFDYKTLEKIANSK